MVKTAGSGVKPQSYFHRGSKGQRPKMAAHGRYNPTRQTAPSQGLPRRPATAPNPIIAAARAAAAMKSWRVKAWQRIRGIIHLNRVLTLGLSWRAHRIVMSASRRGANGKFRPEAEIVRSRLLFGEGERDKLK